MLEVGAVVGQVVVGVADEDLLEVDAHRRERVVVERLDDRLDVEHEAALSARVTRL